MLKILLHISLLLLTVSVWGQEAFTIQSFEVEAIINKDASVDITERIDLTFTEKRHGIIRSFLYKYDIVDTPDSVEQAASQLVSGNKRRLIIENISVEDDKYDVSYESDLVQIKIGSPDKLVDGKKRYVIHYRVLNAINFLKDHAEFYYNLIGFQWNTTIDTVKFKIRLYNPLPKDPFFFIATGPVGSTQNQTESQWKDHQILSGKTTRSLDSYEGVTVGIRMPEGFLIIPDYTFYRGGWLLLPIPVFALMFLIWRRWGKDLEVVQVTEFYPPEKVSPGVCGYIIDGRADRRDLTALVPYWGAGGYLRLHEREDRSFFGLIKNKDYEFEKIRDLPATVEDFEKTLFDGIFEKGDRVMLSTLKNVLYKSLQKAKSELEYKVNVEKYYVSFSRGAGKVFVILGIVIFVLSIFMLTDDYVINRWLTAGMAASAIIMLIFGLLMPKKTKKGTALYAHLLGFKEFLKLVEKERLEQFLKDDEHYFDKVLPFAIVFNIADTWKDKLKGLEIPPPDWYTGTGTLINFNAVSFMSHLDKSMQNMNSAFYSSPSGGAGSGRSFGGGGSAGGGFGGGGGSSW